MREAEERAAWWVRTQDEGAGGRGFQERVLRFCPQACAYRWQDGESLISGAARPPAGGGCLVGVACLQKQRQVVPSGGNLSIPAAPFPSGPPLPARSSYISPRHA